MIYAVRYNADCVEPFGIFETEEEFKAKIQELSEPFFRKRALLYFFLYFFKLIFFAENQLSKNPPFSRKIDFKAVRRHWSNILS